MSKLHSLIIGEGEPLFILHGFLGMGDNWKSLANRFASHRQVHLIDQRNHGRSFHSDDFSYEYMVEDLIAYLNEQELDSTSILGHSMGGKTAMLMAVEHPDRVAQLIVADIGPKFYPPHHQTILDALNAVDFSQVNSRSDIEKVLEGYIPEFGIRQFLLKNVYRNQNKEYAYRFNLPVLEEQYDEVGVALPPRTVFEGETLFLKGANSGYITADDEGLIQAYFPQSLIIEIDNAGHWLHAENPNDFYKAVADFLRFD